MNKAKKSAQTKAIMMANQNMAFFAIQTISKHRVIEILQLPQSRP